MDYSQLEVPGPTLTELSRPFWEAAAQGQLMIQKCSACKRGVFYPRPICPHCWADALVWEQASGKGTLASFSQIWKPGHPGWLPVAPYYVGLVKLYEGPTMLSHIVDPSQSLCLNDEVDFKPVQAGSRILPFFVKMNTKGDT